jgi:3',5'-cyclic-AMP phosphodiesterase
VIRRILHLSDVHAGADGSDAFGVDALTALDEVLAAARTLTDLGLVVVSGDISDDGSEAGLLAVRDRVARFAAMRGIPQIYCMGNHDDRHAFEAVLGTGHHDTMGSPVGQRCDSSPGIAAMSEHDGLRVITLDSMIPGEVHGELDAGQLGWLDEALAAPAAHGSLVVLHHPPFVPAGSRFFSRAALRRPHELAAVLGGRGARAVLCGHFHAPSVSVLAGIPTVVAPAVVWRIDSGAPADVVRGMSGSGASLVDLRGDSPVFQALTVPGPHHAGPLFEVDADTGEPR